MSDVTKAEYDALVAERNKLSEDLNQANLRAESLVRDKASLVPAYLRLYKAFEDVSELIRAQQAKEALSRIAYEPRPEGIVDPQSPRIVLSK